MSIIFNALNSEDKKEEKVSSGDEFCMVQSGKNKKQFNGFNQKHMVIMCGVALVVLVGLLSHTWFKPNKQVVSSKEQLQTKYQPNASDVKLLRKNASSEEADKLLRSGKLDESLKLYLAALAKYPDDYELHSHVGVIYLKKELFSKALQYFNSALELKNDCEKCLNNLGHLKNMLGEKIEAEQYYRKAIRINSSYPDPYFNMGVLREQAGDREVAVKFYQKFLEVNTHKDLAFINKVEKRIEELLDL